MQQDRRSFLKFTGTGLLSFSVGGVSVLMSPAEAKAKNMAYKAFSNDEVKTLEAFAEIIHKGASEAGVAHFVDHQVSEPPDDCKSMVRYFGGEPPFANFYKGGMNALNQISLAVHKKPFAELEKKSAIDVVRSLMRQNPPGWKNAPPAPLFYMNMRNDVVDVLYGTIDGFKLLDVPYMPHIVPAEKW